MKRTLLIDGDILVYKFATSTERPFDCKAPVLCTSS